MVPFHFVALTACLAVTGGPGPTIPPVPDEQQALQRYQETAKAQEEALLALEQAYARVEKAHGEWRTAESQSAAPLHAALLARAAIWQQELAARRQEGDAKDPRAQRKAEQEALTGSLVTLLEARGLTEPVLRNVLAGALAKQISARIGKEDLGGKLAADLEPWLGAERPFAHLWNDALYLHADEARTWRERYDEYTAAGTELDRVRHPESYLPGGAKTQPGMVYVAGGTYAVGPNVGFERKKQQVTIKPFLLDRCEASNSDYLTFLETLPPEQRLAHTPRFWEVTPIDGKARPPGDRIDHPVVGITWRDANAYARFVGKRLPTEDEWEVASRGRDGRAYPWGNEYAKEKCNDASSGLGTTIAVNRSEEGASPFKVLNLAGNVEEWTASLEEGETIEDLPSNIAAVVVRGGHFLSPPENVGGLFRWVAPGGSSRERHLGFRCAADLK